MPIEIFFCYAREDEELQLGLEKQLRALKRQGLIDMWHDRNISAGTEWEKEIDKHLNTAQIILLLVSPDFMDSDYCYGIEMKQAIARHASGEAVVIPIILRPVYWQSAPFGKLQALPTDAIHVTSPKWPNLDEAFYNVAEGIRKVIEEITVKNPKKAIIKKRLVSRFEEMTTRDDRFKKFTEEARAVLYYSEVEAKSLKHDYIGAEHLLLGLLRVNTCIALKVLTGLGAEHTRIRSAVLFLIMSNPKFSNNIGIELELTPNGKKVIELSVDEAHFMNCGYIGTEHLLLGLIHEGENIASEVLDSFGVTLDKARIQTVELFNQP